MRDNSDVTAEQSEQASGPRRGRPRKWRSEAARREHEAAKRRLRNKTHLTSEAFDDVVRLTAAADDLQHRLDGAIKELEELRWRIQELERRLDEASRPARERQQLMVERPAPTPVPKMNRQQRREAERVQRRARP
jgi:chromosome segregation ATPase